MALIRGCLVALVLVAAFRWQTALSALGSYLVCSEAPQHVDLILVLAGDFYGPRVLKAADLARQGYAPRLLISGTPYQGKPEGEFAIARLAQQGYRTDTFESFGHHARSTIEEAIALRPELERRGVQRVLLVTSAYHSRRALTVLRLVCPRIDFISVPAADPYYRADRWWTDVTSRRLFFSEWGRILGSLLLAYPQYQFSNFYPLRGIYADAIYPTSADRAGTSIPSPRQSVATISRTNPSKSVFARQPSVL